MAQQNAALTGLRASQSLSNSQRDQTIGAKAMSTESKLATGWTPAVLEVSRTEKSGDVAKRVSVGKAKYYIPTLSAIAEAIQNAKQITKELEKGEEDDGIPLYDNDIANYVQSALVGKVQVKIRNSLIPESAEFQSDKQPPMSFEELLSPAERTGEAMKRKAESVTAFTGYITTLGKSPQVVANWKNLFRSPEALVSQSPTIKQKALEYLSGFTASLSAENMERYSKQIIAFEEAAKGDGVSEADM